MMEGTNNARAAVDKLLDMYDEYTALTVKIAAAERRLALAKLKNSSGEQIRIELDDLRHSQQQLSDNMTFDTPLVWVMYKFEAYQDEAQPIQTMHDFRLHCSKPGYICTKRFTFLNAHLCNNGQCPLMDDERYPDKMLLSEIFPLLGEIEQDEAFLFSWRAHEYYQEAGIVKKWQDYVDRRG
ncbi:hypothetical protein [Candidatus Nanosynbacter featherlites]|uniref:Uncharacterized protein n=1 Tax=Candidatus Nanosynbacter featherlites TaxID=2572088 RepID=A0A4V1GDL0_9BACT|nr:hypothetical protein [Candidatus Nanosynbacter featherlites]QCT42156.1 hypothetical protein FBF37_01560 [Candidatus Nanosynbacter featherlites]